jgi:hypothetical protein
VYDPRIEDCAEGSDCIQDTNKIETKYNSEHSVSTIMPQSSTSAPYVTSEFMDTVAITAPPLNEGTDDHNTAFVRTSELPEYTSVSHHMKYDSMEGREVTNISKESHHNITQLHPAVDSFEYPKQAYITIKTNTTVSYQMDLQSTTVTNTYLVTTNKSRQTNLTEKDTPKFVTQTHSKLTENADSQNVTAQILSDIPIYKEKHVVSSKSSKAADTEFQPTYNATDEVGKRKQEFIRRTVSSNCISCSKTQTIYSKGKENVFENGTEQSFKTPLRIILPPSNCCEAGRSGLPVFVTQAYIESSQNKSKLLHQCRSKSIGKTNATTREETQNDVRSTKSGLLPHYNKTEESESNSEHYSISNVKRGKYPRPPNLTEKHYKTFPPGTKNIQSDKHIFIPSKTKYECSSRIKEGPFTLTDNSKLPVYFNTTGANLLSSEYTNTTLPEAVNSSKLTSIKVNPKPQSTMEPVTQYGHFILKQTREEHYKTDIAEQVTSSETASTTAVTHGNKYSHWDWQQTQDINKITANTEISEFQPEGKNVTPSLIKYWQSTTKLTVEHTRTEATHGQETYPETELKTSTYSTQHTNIVISKELPETLSTSIPMFNATEDYTETSEIAQQQGGTDNVTHLPPLQKTSKIPRPYSDSKDIKTVSFMPQTSDTLSKVYSIQQVTASLVTQLPPLQKTNTKSTALFELENNTSTIFPLSHSNEMTPNDYSYQHEISATTFLPPLPTSSTTLINYSDSENNTTTTTSTITKTSTTELEFLTSEQVTASPPTLLPSQQESNSEKTAYSDFERNKTSTSSSMSLPHTEVTKSLSDKQDMSTHTTSSPLLHNISTIPAGYCDPENNALSTILPISTTGHSDMDSNTILSHSQKSQSSSIAPNAYTDGQQTTTIMTFLPQSEKTSDIPTLYTDPDYKTVPTLSSVSKTSITESEASFLQQLTALPLTFLQSERSSKELGPHSELDSDTTSYISPTSQLSTAVPRDYSDERETAAYTTSSPQLWTNSMVPNSYFDPDNKTIPTIPFMTETSVTFAKDYSPLQTVSSGTYYTPSEERDTTPATSAEPDIETTIGISYISQSRVLVLNPHSDLQGGAANASSLPPLQTISKTTAYSDPENVTTMSLMPETSTTVSEAYSIKQGTASFTTLLLLLQNSNKRISTHSELDNNTPSTTLPMSYSRKMAPKAHSVQNVISATTFLSPLPTSSTMLISYSESENNNTPTTSTITQTSTTELEVLTSKQVTASPSTLLPSQQESNSEMTACSVLETNKSSRSSSVSLPNTEDTEPLSDKQDVSACTSSPLLLKISTTPVGYSDPENNTVSTILPTSTTGNSDLDNNTVSTHSQKSQLSTATQNAYINGQENTTIMTFLPLPEKTSKVPTPYTDPDYKTVPTLSSVSETIITESEGSCIQQVTASNLTHLTLQRSSTELGPHSDLNNDTISYISPTSQLSTVVPRDYSDERETVAYTTSLPQYWTNSMVPNISFHPDNKTIPIIPSMTHASVTFPKDYSPLQTVSSGTYYTPSEERDTTPATSAEPDIETTTRISYISQSRVLVLNSHSDVQGGAANASSLPPLQTISTTTTAYSDPENVTTVSLMPETSTTISEAYSIKQGTASLTTLLPTLENSNTKPAIDYELDNNTTSTSLHLSHSNEMAPKDYSHLYGIPATTFLPLSPTSSTMATTDSDQKNNTTLKISTTLETNITQSKALTSQHMTTLPPTLLPPQQETNKKMAAYSDLKKDTTSTSSLPDTEVTKYFSDKQYVSTYTTSSLLLHKISTILLGYSDPENNAVSTMVLNSTRGYSDLDNNTISTHSQKSNFSTLEPNVSIDGQGTASIMTFLPLSQKVDKISTPDTHRDYNNIPKLSSVSQTSITESEASFVQNITAPPLTVLPLYRSITQLGPHSELDSETTSYISSTSELSIAERAGYSDEQQTTSFSTPLPQLQKDSMSPNGYYDSGNKTIPTVTSMPKSNATFTVDYSTLQKIVSVSYYSTYEDNKTVLTTTEPGIETTTRISYTSQSKLYSDKHGGVTNGTFLPQLQTINTTTAYSNPDNITTVSLVPEHSATLESSIRRTAAHSELDNNTIQTGLSVSQSNTVVPQAYFDQHGISGKASTPPLPTNSTTSATYSYPEYNTFKTNISELETFSSQQVTSLPPTLLPPQHEISTEQTVYSEQETNKTSTCSLILLPSCEAQKDFTNKQNVSTHTTASPLFQISSTIPETYFSTENNTVSIILQTTITDHSDLDKSTSSTSSQMSRLSIVVPNLYTDDQETTTFMAFPPLSQTVSQAPTVISNPDDKPISNVSPVSQTNITELEAFSVHQVNTSPLTFLPFQRSSTELAPSSELNNDATSINSPTSQPSTSEPKVYSDEQETTAYSTSSPPLWTTSTVPNVYSASDSKTILTISTIPQTNNAFPEDYSNLQTISSVTNISTVEESKIVTTSSSEPDMEKTTGFSFLLQSRIIVSKSYSDQQQGIPNETSLSPLQTISTKSEAYSDATITTTEALMSEPSAILPNAFSIQQANTTLITMLSQLQNSNTKTTAHSEQGNNTTSTGLPLSNSNDMAPKAYSDQPGISATTFLPPLSTESRMLLSYSHSENNTTPTISTIVQSNITEFEPFINKQVTALPPTLLPSQQEINSGTTDYSYLENNKTFASSPISLPNTEITNTFSVKQEVSAYTTFSPLLHNISTTPVGYSDPENNTISTMLQNNTTGHSGLENNAISTSSRMSHLSTVIPVVYADNKKTTTVMTNSHLSETINKGPTSYTDPDYRTVPTVSSVSETSITESEASFAQQVTASPFRLLPLQRSSTELGHHSELKNDTSYISPTSQLSTAVPTDSSDEQETIGLTAPPPQLQTNIIIPNDYSGTDNKTIPTITSVPESNVIFPKDFSTLQTISSVMYYSQLEKSDTAPAISSEPGTETTIRISSSSQSRTLVSNLYPSHQGGTANASSAPPLNKISTITTAYSDPDNTTTPTSMSEPRATVSKGVSIHQVTPSLITLLSSLETSTSSKKPAAHSELDNNTNQTGLHLSQSNTIVLKTYSDQNGVSGTTSLPKLSPYSITSTTYSDQEYNTIQTISTILQTNVTEIEALSSQQMTASPSTLLSPQQELNTEQTDYSEPGTNTTSASSLISLTSSENPKDFTDEQEVSTYTTSSQLFQVSSTVPGSYSYTENNTVSTIVQTTVRDHSDLYNNTSSTSSQMSRLSTVVPNLYTDDQETTTFMAFLPLSETVRQVAMVSPDLDNKPIPTISTLSESNITESEGYTIHQVNTSPLTFLPFQISSTELATNSELDSDATSDNSPTSQPSTAVPKVYSDGQETTSSPPLWTINTVLNGNTESDKKTIATTSSVLETYATFPTDYSVLHTVSPATYLSTSEESETVPTTSSKPDMEMTREFSSMLQARTFVSKSYSDQQQGTANAKSSPPLQTIRTIPTAYSDPDNITVSLIPESSAMASKAYSMQQVTSSLTTMLQQLQNSNTKPTAHSELDNNTTSTSLPLSHSNEMAPKAYSDHYEISATTPLPPLPTSNTMATTDPDSENNTTETISTIIETNVTESITIISQQMTASPPTLLPPQQEINTKPTAYSDLETNKTSTCSLISPPSSQVPEDLYDKQDVSAYSTPSSLSQISTSIPRSNSHTEINNMHAVLETSTTDHSDLDNNTISTHSQKSQSSTVAPNVYIDGQETTTIMTFIYLSEKTSKVLTPYTDPDYKTVPRVSSVSKTTVTESESSFVQQATASPSTYLPLQRSSAELGSDSELYNDTTSQI